MERARARLRRRADVQRGDVNALAFPDRQFRTVVALNVLHHVAEPLRAMREIHRVLQPGGRFLFMDYAWGSYPRFLRRFFPPDSVFTREDFTRDLRRAGFDDVRLRGRGQLRGSATRLP